MCVCVWDVVWCGVCVCVVLKELWNYPHLYKFSIDAELSASMNNFVAGGESHTGCSPSANTHLGPACPGALVA